MNEDRLSWLRGPLPPLSEAIKQSGLLVGNDIPDIPQQPPFSLPTELPKEQSKTLKKKVTKLPSPKEVKPRAKSKIQTPLQTLSPENFALYRPPPVESLIGGVAKHVQHFKAPDFGEEKNSIKLEIQRLNDSLDETIKKLLPHKEMNDEEKFEYTMKMVRVHNYAVNQLVLLDKNNCSDRALFIKRLATFYQEVIDDFPSYFTRYNVKINDLASEVQKYKELSEKVGKENVDNKQKVEELQKKIEELEKDKETITKTSNDKDVDIQALQDKVQLYEASNINFQFKLKKEKEEKEQYQELYRNICEDQKKQLETIQELSKQLKTHEDGDSSVVWDLRKAQVRINELQEQNTNLHKTIYALEHKEMVDACVDTADLPQEVKTKKKKKNVYLNVQNDPNFVPNQIATMTSQGRFNYSGPSSGKISACTSMNTITAQTSDCGMKRVTVTKMVETQTDPPELSEIEVQTDPVEIGIPVQKSLNKIPSQNSRVSFEAHNSVASLSAQSLNSDSATIPEQPGEEEHAPATVAVEFTEEELKSAIDINEIEFEPVSDYEVDEEELKKIPNLFPTLVPIFGSPFRVVQPRELDRLNIGKMSGVKKQDRSLVWGLGLINNFLCDPFIRSYEAAQLDGAEAIFVEWLVRQYRVSHLVNQICADISMLIYTNREDEQMIRLFSNMMENHYSYAQICFISSIYSFALNLTHPKIPALLQEIDLIPTHPKVLIHTVNAFTLLSQAMSSILATAFFRAKINPKEPMMNFVDFLVQAAAFFNEKHQQLFTRSSDILTLCSWKNVSSNNGEKKQAINRDIVVTYDIFNKFMCLLDSVEDHKHWWESILLEKKDTSLDITSLIAVCAERRRPLLELLRLDRVSTKIAMFNTYKPLVQEFYQHFLKRFTQTIPTVLEKLPQQILQKVTQYVEDLRNDFLNIDFPQFLWHYRIFLSIIDQGMLDVVHQIPFAMNSPDSVFNDLIDFYNMTEKVSFSLMIDHENE